jgi:hypothetical protein
MNINFLLPYLFKFLEGKTLAFGPIQVSLPDAGNLNVSGSVTITAA